MNALRMWDLDGKEIDITKFGLQGLRLIIPAPSYNVSQEYVEGRPGAIILGKDLAPRNLKAEFLVTSFDYEDSLLLRDEIYSLFNKGTQFYIGEKKQPGKRWFVQCTEEWTPERISSINLTVQIPLIAESGMAESVGTTLDPFTFDAELWQFGEGLSADDLIYTFNTPSFRVYNAGDIAINPRNMALDITFTGASSDLTIKNETTGDMWKYTGNTNASDVVKLTGVRAIKNGLSIFRDTNRKLITIAPGWNDFTVAGASGSFTVKFDFRFYFL